MLLFNKKLRRGWLLHESPAVLPYIFQTPCISDLNFCLFDSLYILAMLCM